MPAPPRDIAIVHTRAETVAQVLQSLGYNPLPCPSLSITYLNPIIPPADLYIVSSAHALPALAAIKQPIIAVGEETQNAVVQAGLTLHPLSSLTMQDIDISALKNKNCLHIGGRDLSPDTETFINSVNAARVISYEANAISALPDVILSSLQNHQLHAVLVFSARAGDAFTSLAKRATNELDWHNVTAVALSPRVANSLSGLPFGSIRVAATPNRKAMIEALTHESRT